MSGWKTHVKRDVRAGKYRGIRDMLVFIAMKKGELSLSRGSWRILGSPEYVKFVTDDRGRGGFMACMPDDIGAYKVQDRNGGNILRIGCKGVTNRYGLSDDIGNRLYTLRKEEDVLVFSLGQGFERI